MRKVAFLCHPSRRWERKFPPILEKIYRTPGFEKGFFQVDPTQGNSTERLLEKAVKEGYETVIAIGGDGTLNRLLNFFGEKNLLSKITLGILPFGTCNDFARYLGLKSGDWETLFHSILEWKVKRFQVARVNRHLFINNAGFGREAPGLRKSNLLKDIQSLKPVYTKILWENHKVEGNFMMMVCANGPFFSGGLHFSQISNPGDSLLEFFFVGKMNKLKLVRKLIFGKRGRPLLEKPQERSILQIQTSKLTMETSVPVWVMRDGEMAEDLSGVRKVTFETDGVCQMVVP